MRQMPNPGIQETNADYPARDTNNHPTATPSNIWYNLTMTTKQARVIDNVLKAGLNITQARLKAGYSPKTANKTEQTTNSEAWRKTMETYLPDHKLFKKHEEALEATKHVLLDDGNMVKEADHNIRLKAIDMAYKLKGRDMVNQGNIGQQVNIMLDSSGYVPPNNVLGLKPTLKTTK